MTKKKEVKKKELPEIVKVDSAGEVKQPVKVFNLPKKKKVAIVGCSDTKGQTPFHLKDEFEFWGVNNLFTNMQGKPWTRWFEIHHIEKDPITEQWQRKGSNDFRGMPVDKYLRSLQDLNVPVYMRSACDLVPNAVLYPIKDILNKFGDYFTNTISYMLAIALMEGHYEEIHVYGVDMAVDSEYFWQRPSCEYFIGIAKGMGIKVVMPVECDLLKTRFLYGFDDRMEDKWMKKVDGMIQSMQTRHTTALQKKKIATQQVEQYVGGISAAHEMKKVWKNL